MSTEFGRATASLCDYPVSKLFHIYLLAHFLRTNEISIHSPLCKPHMTTPNHLPQPEFLASTLPELRLTTAVETIRRAHEAGDQELEIQSLTYLRAQAANGQHEARTKISALYEHGDAGVPRDTQEAMIWSRGVFDKQIAKALQLCAQELTDLEAVRRHPHSTYALIAEAAKQAQPNASYLAAIMLMKGVGVSQNVEAGLSHLTKAAEANQVDAQYELGRFYGERFKYSVKDTRRSLYWYDRAVQNGDTRALIDLAYTYFEGDDTVSRDYERAFKYAKQGAETGDKYCQYIVGDLYLRGRGTLQNPEQAVRWLTQSGEQGFSMAIEELAVIFFKGFGGVPQNYENAYYWCTKGSEVWPSGLGYCQAALGDMYRNGYYVKKNTQYAFKWYQKAANQTNSPQSYAQYILGEM